MTRKPAKKPAKPNLAQRFSVAELKGEMRTRDMALDDRISELRIEIVKMIDALRADVDALRRPGWRSGTGLDRHFDKRIDDLRIAVEELKAKAAPFPAPAKIAGPDGCGNSTGANMAPAAQAKTIPPKPAWLVQGMAIKSKFSGLPGTIEDFGIWGGQWELICQWDGRSHDSGWQPAAFFAPIPAETPKVGDVVKVEVEGEVVAIYPGDRLMWVRILDGRWVQTPTNVPFTRLPAKEAKP